MGFLNHATNNIIVDAVLTERGRELLSRNDGSFNITSFSFADDEVDYEILKHYGLIIGKEKIEKNTPIFEATTDVDTAIKYENLSLTNNTTSIYAFPKIKFEDENNSTFTLSSNSASSNNTSLTVSLKTYVNQDSDFSLTESGLLDEEFYVRVFDELLELEGETIEPPTGRNSISEYTLVSSQTSTRVSQEFVGQRFVSFTITALNKVTSSTYQYYASSSNSNEIKTQIEVEGVSSGATFIIPVTITSNTL